MLFKVVADIMITYLDGSGLAGQVLFDELA
jgi:hypothetical protein